MENIAFLGLGAMGSRMATRLLNGGFNVTVWNRTASTTRPLEALGAQVASTPAEAASTADIVITMVTDDDAARSVWLGPDGALSRIRPGTLIAEASTVSIDWVKELATAASAANVDLIEAPVAGSRPQAEAGELVFLMGGAAEDVDRFRPAAEAMGKAVIHAGDLGHGAVLKLMVNTLLGVQTVMMGEVMRFAEAHGMPAARALELLSPLPVTSTAAAGQGALIAQRKSDPMFTIDLIVKDLTYFLSEDAPLAEATKAAFKAAQAGGLGGRHITAVAG